MSQNTTTTTAKPSPKKARRKAMRQQQRRLANGPMPQFFDAVRQYPCLYDPADPLYEDQQCREHVWQQLAEEFHMPDARDQWNNIIEPTKRGRLVVKTEFARAVTWLTPYLKKLSDYMKAKGIPIPVHSATNGTTNVSPAANGAPSVSPAANGAPSVPPAANRAPVKKEPIESTKMDKIFAAVQKHNVLYDPGHSQFHNASFKAEAWRRVVQESGFRDAQRQWSTVIVRQNVINGIQMFALRKAYRSQLKWLNPFVRKLGPIQDRENSMKTIDAVRPYPELYDDAHPHAKDEAHINALWEQLKEDTKIEYIANRWYYLKKGLADGKTDASGFAYVKELEWLLPFVQQSAHPLADKSVAAGWAPQPEGGTAVWSNGTNPPASPVKMPWSKPSEIAMRNGKLIDRQPIDEPPEKKQRIEKEEEHLTCMLGSMLDMLREMPAEKRWDAYDNFREFFFEVTADEAEEEPEVIELMDEDGDDQPTTSGN